MIIFVDAMGGDRAPDCVLKGVELVKDQLKARIAVLGDRHILEPWANNLRGVRPEIIHCSEVIAMDESPVQAVRAKKDSTIVRGLKLTAETSDSAFFSAGHSGAVFAAALLALGRIKGVERPAIATVMPGIGPTNRKTILLDAGANVDCRPEHLVDFARMGTTYARVYLQQKQPKIAILSNGEEESKGNELTRAADELLRLQANLNYVGYLEGKEITSGKVDVVVTDGFTGNVVLKSLEGLGSAVLSLFRREFGRSWTRKLGALFLLPVLNDVKRKFDYAETGAAPLLGVDGNCFIGHGRSNPRAIRNGILRAEEAIALKFHELMRQQFTKGKESK